VFINVNQLVKNIINPALRIQLLIIPDMEPAKYNGTNIQVAGSSIVNVITALAIISASVSNISQ
jgi:hypothetical protein